MDDPNEQYDTSFHAVFSLPDRASHEIAFRCVVDLLNGNATSSKALRQKSGGATPLHAKEGPTWR